MKLVLALGLLCLAQLCLAQSDNHVQVSYDDYKFTDVKMPSRDYYFQRYLYGRYRYTPKDRYDPRGYRYNRPNDYHRYEDKDFHYEMKEDYFCKPNEDCKPKDDRYKVKEFKSCKEVLEYYPDSPSGYYWLVKEHYEAKKVYCDMETDLCGKRGWEKFYHLDMKANHTQPCPGDFKKVKVQSTTSSEVEEFYCEGKTNNSCSSAKFYLDGSRYYEMCAKLGGYQKGHPTAFYPYHKKGHEMFMEGLTFSYGTYHQHLWSYAVGAFRGYKDANMKKDSKDMEKLCPETFPEARFDMPHFMGNDYYCDSGVRHYTKEEPGKFYHSYRLWEGEFCEEDRSYPCRKAGQPWFYKMVPSYIHDYLELNSCMDDKVAKRNVLLDNVEVFFR